MASNILGSSQVFLPHIAFQYIYNLIRPSQHFLTKEKNNCRVFPNQLLHVYQSMCMLCLYMLFIDFYKWILYRELTVDSLMV